MDNNFSVAVMYAITPCHAGSGSSVGVVDLPIQRERHSNWPVIQASGVKGAFRANFDRYKNNINDEDKSKLKDFNNLAETIFGPGNDNNNSGYAGSTSFSDAKILAFPMRSNVSPFVWITCPSVLKRLVRDLEFAGKIEGKITIPEVGETNAICLSGNLTGNVLLEDFEVTVSKSEEIEAVKDYLISAERLLLVSDEVFNYGVSDCTQIMAQIKIDSSTGTTKDGSLRYQEELPGDTIMYSVIHWGDSKNAAEKLQAETIQKFIESEVIKSHIQIAGDETCGRGIFKLDWK